MAFGYESYAIIFDSTVPCHLNLQSGAVSSSSTAAMAGLGSLPTTASPSGATGAGGGGVSPIPPVTTSLNLFIHQFLHFPRQLCVYNF